MADFRIYLFQNFSTLLSAGIPILRAIRTLQSMSPRRHQRLLRQIEKEIADGSELSEAIAKRPRLFQELDVMLVRVGEQTGQLAEILKGMGEWYQMRQSQLRRVLLGLIYPFLILHFAIFTLPIPMIVFSGGGWKEYIRYVSINLLSLYLFITAIYILYKLTSKCNLSRKLLDGFVLYIPILGSAFRCLAIGRYCSVFSIMYKAGIPILKCAELAPATCGNEAMASKFEKAYYTAKTGLPMSQGFSKSLPPDFLELWSIGEESGDLDKTTDKLAEIYLDKAQFRLNLISIWTPRIFYFAILFVLAYFIIKAILHIYVTIINNTL